MKPIFGIDLTNDKTNETMNDAAFVDCHTSPALSQALERLTEQAESTVDKAKLSRVLRIIQALSGFTAFVTIFGTVKALTGEDSVTLSEAYQNAPALFWVGGCCLVLWAILKLLSLKKQKAVLESDEGAQTFQNLEGVSEAIFTELSAPKGTPDVDIFFFAYKSKENEVKVVSRGMFQYVNAVFRIYADNEALYLVNLEARYAFPHASLRAIHTVKKTISAYEWNKDADVKDDRYKPYKLSLGDANVVNSKWYHILEMEHEGERYGLYFPSYELPAFEALTGLKAETI